MGPVFYCQVGMEGKKEKADRIGWLGAGKGRRQAGLDPPLAIVRRVYCTVLYMSAVIQACDMSTY